MGCDIHLYIEQQQADRTWRRVQSPPWVCSWCLGQPMPEGRKQECYNCGGSGKTAEAFNDRNYDLFGMLANIRNGRGFAGVDTEDGFVPLAEPRGKPKDMSPELKRGKKLPGDEYAPYLGDHSFSYATLAEVLEYDYSRTTKKRGIVSDLEYHKWVQDGRKGSPDSWRGGVSGSGVRHVTQKKMDKLIANGDAGPNCKDKLALRQYYTEVEWEVTYRESAGGGWFAFLEACTTLGDPKKVRLVFGFDS